MPDLITHALGPYFAARYTWKTDRASMVVFILGTMLPDLVSRPPNYALIRWFPLVNDLTGPLHSPFMAVLYCLVVSYLFAEPMRRKAYILLLAGSWVHLALDALQIHVGSGYYMLFPLSRWKHVQGLIWPEDSLFIVPVLLVCWLGLLIVQKTRKATRQ